MGDALEYIGIVITVVVLGVLISLTPMHHKLSRKPWIGVLLFLTLGYVLYSIWGGIWQFWALYFIMALVLLEYIFLLFNKNRQLQVTVKFNRKMFVICAYVCLCGSLLFTPFIRLDSVFPKQLVGSWMDS